MATRRRLGVLAILAAGGVIVAVGYYLWPPAGDRSLRAFVHSTPPVPIVFTSRSEPMSLVAAAPQGEGYTAPGQRLWAATEGRLRLLTPRGTVHELTWGKRLADGSTLIDVMSPSVSPDGRTIIFAGRRSTGHGRFRLYEINVDGTGLTPLTGGDDDPGCTNLPPMRYADDGMTRLSDDQRRREDYDDFDPIHLNVPGQVLFASSREPDLGRGHSRRSTALWVMSRFTQTDGKMSAQAVTANRNNDRWPVLLKTNLVAFSLWSRNPEVVTGDERDIQPFDPTKGVGSWPADNWLGAFTGIVSPQFGGLIKPHVPVWRMRPLFNGKFVFMTSFEYPAPGHGTVPPVLWVVQAEPGLLHNVPSAKPADSNMPLQERYAITRGPERDTDGRPLSLATPSPCPDHHVVMSGAVLEGDDSAPQPGGYGLYLAGDDWSSDSAADPDAVKLRRLFDDPRLEDSEPVAVYNRGIAVWDKVTDPKLPSEPGPITLADGSTYRGPVGHVFASGLYMNQHFNLPGQKTDAGQRPIFDAPPKGSLDHLRIYASRRDRFDDPEVPRIPGRWELLLKVPITNEGAGAMVPSGVPTVLAGFDNEGKVLRWTTKATDRNGTRATFYAFAGDHYSGARPGARHFCIGCHPGHSGLGQTDHRHHEKMK